ncbi:Metallopeptidase toxin 2 [Chitinophaga sp. CF418]|nr:Metallopeptidase toxin 2 [Chitinophaga sp. CF418]
MDIFVNKNKLKIPEPLGDFNVMKSALIHEDLHKKDNIKNVAESFLLHTNVYLNQMKDPTFAKVPERYQLGWIASFAQFVLNYYDQEGINGFGPGIESIVDDFNKNGKSGHVLKVDVSAPKSSSYSFQIYRNGKKVGEGKMEPKTSPH